MLRLSNKTLAALAIACLGLNAASPASLGRAAQDDESPMITNMEVIEHGMKDLRRSVRSSEGWPSALGTVAELQLAVLHCKGEVPSMAASRPESERADFVSAYRKEMAVMLQALTQLEIALLDGDEEAVPALYKTIRAMEDSGHDRFTEE